MYLNHIVLWTIGWFEFCCTCFDIGVIAEIPFGLNIVIQICNVDLRLDLTDKD